ncbi:ribonuclease E inhibitor RraB [Paenibacillus thiaminolyticus]
MTTHGLRDVFYYFSKPYELEKVAEMYFIEHGYEIEVHNIEEENPRDFYFEFLYPNKYQLQHMGNRKVVDQLRESGDTFENSRRVDHWIYFKSTEDKENFDAKAILLGFNIDSDPSHDERMCSHIYRSVTLTSIR